MTSLPVIGRPTSAASTAFVHAMVDLLGHKGQAHRLHIDGNQKITWANGSYNAPEPNAFSVVNVEDCPGSTPTCRASCYVQGIEKYASDLFSLYRHNSHEIREILEGVSTYRCARQFARWITEHASGGFRWHVSGDVFSEPYAEWIAAVCAYSSYVQHWIYTRSFHLIEPLLSVRTGLGGNLAINLSADQDNYASARALADRYDLRVCYMVIADGVVPEGMRDEDILFPDYALRGAKGATPVEIRAGSEWYQGLANRHRRMICPVDFYSKSEGNRCGPCRRCLI